SPPGSRSTPASPTATTSSTSTRPSSTGSSRSAARAWPSTCRRRRGREQILERPHQRHQAHGLDEVGLEPRLARARAIGRAAVAAQGDEAQALVARVAAQAGGELEAVDLVQAEVEDRGGRGEALGGGERGRAVVGDPRLVAGG